MIFGMIPDEAPIITVFMHSYDNYPEYYYHYVYTVEKDGLYYYLTCKTEHIISQFAPSPGPAYPSVDD